MLEVKKDMKCDGIIFDVDGTLWDATKQILQAHNKVIKEDGRCEEISYDTMCSVMGMILKDIADVFFPNLEKEERWPLMQKCCEYEVTYLYEEKGILYPHVKEVLEALHKKIPVFIVSNCQDGYIEVLMETHELTAYIRDYECEGRSGKVKADNIKDIVYRNQLKYPVYVGDTNGDSTACQEAGVPFIYITHGFGETNQYDAKIDDLNELLDLIEPVEKKEEVKKFKLFFVSDMDEEAAYLREMSLQGYHFVEKFGMIYTFEKGEPKNYAYHLGYYEQGMKDEERFVANYREAGWESIYHEKSEFDGMLHYFRTSLNEEEEPPFIYSDLQPRMMMYQRLLSSWRNLITMIVLFLLCMVWTIWFLARSGVNSPIVVMLIASVCILLTLTLALYLHIYLKVKRKLKQFKYES